MSAAAPTINLSLSLTFAGIAESDYSAIVASLNAELLSFKWRNISGDTVMRQLLSEVKNSKDAFFIVAKKLIDSLSWFSKNIEMIDNMIKVFTKKKVYGKLKDNMKNILKGETFGGTKASLHVLSEVTEVWAQRNELRKAYASIEMQEALLVQLILLQSATASIAASVSLVTQQPLIRGKLYRNKEAISSMNLIRSCILIDSIWSADSLHVRTAICKRIDAYIVEISAKTVDKDIKSDSILYNELAILYELVTELNKELAIPLQDKDGVASPSRSSSSSNSANGNVNSTLTQGDIPFKSQRVKRLRDDSSKAADAVLKLPFWI